MTVHYLTRMLLGLILNPFQAVSALGGEPDDVEWPIKTFEFSLESAFLPGAARGFIVPSDH